MDGVQIGERIKRARAARGLSLRAVGGAVGLSAQAISKYERGLTIPASGVLLRLARALDVGVEFLLRPTSVGALTLVRTTGSRLSTAQERSLLARARDWLERYAVAERLLDEVCAPGDHAVLPEGFPHAVRDEAAAEDAAATLRHAWGIGDGPIASVAGTLEDHGVMVGAFDGEEGFDARAARAEVDGVLVPVIALNIALPGELQRAALARELGRLALDVPPAGDSEACARAFAAAFLVPAEVARRELGIRRHALDLCELRLLERRYRFSLEGWIDRAAHLAIITTSERRRLRRLMRNAEPADHERSFRCPPERPARLAQLVFHALAEGVIGETRAGELLGHSVRDLRRATVTGDGGLRRAAGGGH